MTILMRPFSPKRQTLTLAYDFESAGRMYTASASVPEGSEQSIERDRHALCSLIAGAACSVWTRGPPTPAVAYQPDPLQRAGDRQDAILM